MINKFTRKTQYYETDQMGVVHHSNYIRWFEEARTDMMEKMGFSYARTEAEGILIPVLGVSCRYISPVKYGENVDIVTKVDKFSGVRMTLSYRITDAQTGILRTEGESQHCFVDKSFRPVSLSKSIKELYDIFKAMEGKD